MTWMMWRQHRGELAGAGLLLALLGLMLLWHGVPMRHAYEAGGIRACQLEQLGLSVPASPSGCGATLASFEHDHARLPEQVATWLPFMPLLAGMLVGAPLLSREFEQGTWQLAWTQGVTRRRWLATKVTGTIGGAVVVAVLFAAGVSWWFEPLSPQRFTPEKFNHAVLVLPAYVALAVALGIVAGAVFRRTVVAAAVTVVCYLMIRIPLEFVLRPHYRQPRTADDAATAATGWLIEGGPGSAGPVRYQPDDRFWQFQLIETAVLAGLAIALIALTWRVVVGSARRSQPLPGTDA